jgi:S-adenosylmethionine synthetase
MPRLTRDHVIDLITTQPLPRIIHYSAQEPYTKYEMCLVFAKILRLSHGHIVPDAEEPKGEAAVSRPRDTHLSVEETENLNVEDGLDCSLFEEWWEKRLNG